MPNGIFKSTTLEFLEAYSWGVGEYYSECCCDGVREGVDGSSVTGLEGVPVFEVGDGLFDSPSDFSDGPVVDLVRFGLGWACWFLGGGDQV